MISFLVTILKCKFSLGKHCVYLGNRDIGISVGTLGSGYSIVAEMGHINGWVWIPS